MDALQALKDLKTQIIDKQMRVSCFNEIYDLIEKELIEAQNNKQNG